MAWVSVRCVRWHLPLFWLQPRAPWISSRRFCWHRPAPLTTTLIRTSQTGNGHMVLCLLQTLCRSSSRFGTIQVFCPPVQPWSQAISDTCQKARFLWAAVDRRSALAVALRLGCSVCVAHICRCGALIDAQGVDGSVCKIARH